ncbi:MAG: hypothetical protein GOU97_04420 [Nanoarchaeota archaeon]|nr:hypothetical protein [Nanoarchaeota archaeon]
MKKGILMSLMTLAFFTVISSLVFLVFTQNNNYSETFVNSIAASRTSQEANTVKNNLFKATNFYHSVSSSDSVNLTFHSYLNPFFNASHNMNSYDSFLTRVYGISHDFSNLISSVDNGYLEQIVQPYGILITNNYSAQKIVWNNTSSATALKLKLPEINQVTWQNDAGSLKIIIESPEFYEEKLVGEANVTVETNGSSNVTWRVRQNNFTLNYSNSSGEIAELTLVLPEEESLRINFVQEYGLNVSVKGYFFRE